MTHVAPRPARGAGLFVRIVYFLARRRLGRVPSPIAITAHHRGLLAALGSFELALERCHEVDPRLKLLAEVKTASLIGCRFCIDIGTAIAAKTGVSEAKLRALPFHETSNHFTHLERQVLDYVVQMSETPARPEPDLFQDLVAALGVPAVLELTAAIAWENYRARFNHAVGAIEEGYSEGMVCLLPPAVEELRSVG